MGLSNIFTDIEEFLKKEQPRIYDFLVGLKETVFGIFETLGKAILLPFTAIRRLTSMDFKGLWSDAMGVFQNKNNIGRGLKRMMGMDTGIVSMASWEEQLKRTQSKQELEGNLEKKGVTVNMSVYAPGNDAAGIEKGVSQGLDKSLEQVKSDFK